MIIINFTVGTILTIVLFVLGIRAGLRNKLRAELARSLTFLFFGVLVFGLESQRVVDVLKTGFQRAADIVGILLNRSGERNVSVPNVQQAPIPVQWFDLIFTVATLAAGYSVARAIKKRDGTKPGTFGKVGAIILGVVNWIITALLIFIVATKFFGTQWQALLGNSVNGSIGVPNVNTLLPSFSGNPFVGWGALAIFIFFIVLIGIVISTIFGFISGSGGGGGSKPGGGGSAPAKH